jgi:site-specific recombinase XerC
MRLDDVIAEFVADQRLAGRADGTISNHHAELSRLDQWIRESGVGWQQLSRRHVQQYARSRAHLGPSSRANTLTTLRVFFRWAADQEYVSSSPAVGLPSTRKPTPLPRALSLDQVRQLIQYIRHAESRREHRDAALVFTGLYTGFRASELAALRWPVVDMDGRAINIRLSKGGKGRAVKIHKSLAPVLTSWRELQALGEQAPVFSLSPSPISGDRVSKICHAISLASGVPFTTHVLRHTWATWGLRSSGNLFAVSKGLGHAALKQTEIYISANTDESATAVDSLPDIESW